MTTFTDFLAACHLYSRSPDLPEGRCRRDDEHDIQHESSLTLRCALVWCATSLLLCVDRACSAFNLRTPEMGWIIIHPPIVPDARGVHPGIVTRGAVPVDAQPLLPHIATQLSAGASHSEIAAHPLSKVPILCLNLNFGQFCLLSPRIIVTQQLVRILC
ncbi:hypothetical protein EDD22DRAFT_519602 [Suillus occidentalis]|nr:hypothetical protein EDD22DRAFT_519602 [Suillus occidentalis]